MTQFYRIDELPLGTMVEYHGTGMLTITRDLTHRDKGHPVKIGLEPNQVQFWSHDRAEYMWDKGERLVGGVGAEFGTPVPDPVYKILLGRVVRWGEVTIHEEEELFA